MTAKKFRLGRECANRRRNFVSRFGLVKPFAPIRPKHQRIKSMPNNFLNTIHVKYVFKLREIHPPHNMTNVRYHGTCAHTPSAKPRQRQSYAIPARCSSSSKSYSGLRALRRRKEFAAASPTNISVATSHVSLRLSFMLIQAAAQASRLRVDC